jgi:hypothetical protein
MRKNACLWYKSKDQGVDLEFVRVIVETIERYYLQK